MSLFKNLEGSPTSNNIDDRKRFIRQIEKLPTLPVIVYKILETLEDPKSSAEDLKKTIINDQSLSAKVLKLANSAYYGYNRNVTDITKAVVLLGFDTIKSLCLTISIIDTIPEAGVEYSFKREDLWMHATFAAYTAQTIFENAGFKNTEKVFVHGLLHDLGKVVMTFFYPEEYEKAIGAAKTNKTEIIVEERKQFGFDHTDAGFWLGEQWQFPASILTGIRFHHNPFDAPPELQESALVSNLSDAITHSSDFEETHDNKVIEIDRKVINTLNLSDKDLSNIISELKSKVPEIETFYSAIF